MQTPVQFLGQEVLLEKGQATHSSTHGLHWWSDGKESASNEGHLVQSLGWEAPLEEGMATHSSVLAWRIAMDRGAWWATSPCGCKESGMTESQLSIHSTELIYNVSSV